MITLCTECTEADIQTMASVKYFAFISVLTANGASKEISCCVPLNNESIRIIFEESVESLCSNGYSKAGCGISMQIDEDGNLHLMCPRSCAYHAV